MKLNEVYNIEDITDYRQLFFKTREEIEEQLRIWEVSAYTINQDLTVDVRTDVNLSKKQIPHLPFQFGIVKGFFTCTYNDMITLLGCPLHVGRFFSCYQNPIQSLKYAPITVGGGNNHFNCRLTDIKSLHNIHKRIKSIESRFECGDVTNMLGLLLIDGLKKIRTHNFKVEEIINFHLQHGKDIHACQEDLIEAGFPEQARI